MDIREANSADRDAILGLRARCFGDLDPEKRDPRFWHWELGHARCFVGEENGRLVTHLALVPMPYAAGDEVIDGALAVDAMTAPEARGRGAFSRVVAEAMQATRGDLSIATAYQIRSAVLGAMLRGGWSVAADVPVLVRPASLRALLRITARTGTHRAPRPRARIRLLTRDDAPAMARVARSFPREGACVARTAEWLTWRFFENPCWSYRVTGIDEEGDLAAYLVARRTTLKNFDTFAVADLAYTDRDSARLLLRDAVAEGKALGCKLAAALVSPWHPAFSLFLMRGFVPGPHRFRLLVYPNRKLRWGVMWADTDHL